MIIKFLIAFRLLAGIVLCLLCLNSFAQNVQIAGKVIDVKNKRPLEFVTVNLLHAKDSTLYLSKQTDRVGNFTISSLPGTYLLKVSMIGYKSVIKSDLVIIRSVNLGELIMEEGIDLKAIEILGGPISITLKKDTIEYNAGSFKTTPDANVETLVKTMPGIEVDHAGNIKAQGEDVKRVTVDGNEFFGNDPKMATKNLPADAIAKVQIIDDRTKNSKEIGIDDGRREKVMNLVLKSDKKGGWFGNASTLGGTKEHYSGSASLNHFNKDKQINFILLSNNINQGYSGGDLVNLVGGGISISGGGSGQVNGINFGDSNAGLTKLNSGAANFSDSWGKKNDIKFRATYNGSVRDNDVKTLSDIQNIQSNGTFYNANDANASSTIDAHMTDLYIAYSDSLNRVSFSPTFKWGGSRSNDFKIASIKNDQNQLINTNAQKVSAHTLAPNFSGYLTAAHNFKQKKGAIAITIRRNYAKNFGDNTNENTIQYYKNGTIDNQTAIDQFQDITNINAVLGVQNTISRTLSRDKKTSAVITNRAEFTDRNSDQLTYEYNSATGRYETIVPLLTNSYDNKLSQYGSEFGINKVTEKITLKMSANAQTTRLKGSMYGNNQLNELSRNYFLLLPTATFSYRTKAKATYSFNINSNITIPSIENLQPVQNNINPLYIREGNPNLKPSRSYSSRFGFNAFNPKNNLSFTYSLSYSVQLSAFSTANTFDAQTGISNVRPVNVNGNYNLNATAYLGRPIFVKDLRIGLSANMSKSNIVNFVNAVENNTGRLVSAGSVNLNYVYKESLNIFLTTGGSYTDVENSSLSQSDNNYFIFNNTANISYEFIKKWRFNASMNHQSYSGANFNQSLMLVNAGIQKYFMEKNQLSLELRSFDLLNQNSGISRMITDNRIEDIQINNIRQYFALRLTYKVNKVAPSGK